MGVDARILLKITDSAAWLDAAQLRNISARLTEAIGYDHFFIDTDEDRHAISFVIDENKKYPADYEQEPGKPFDPTGPAVYGQDSNEEPYLIAKPNEQFLEVHLFSRYYGEDYARGDWPMIYFTLMWCFHNIPHCEVWYGGDSSGCLMEHMTVERMVEVTKFFLTTGYKTYRTYARDHEYICEFCKVIAIRSGGGGGTDFYSCDSCGQHWNIEHVGAFKRLVTRFGDEPTDDKHDNKIPSFTMSQQMREGKRTLYPFDGIFRKRYAPKVEKQTVQ
jgi:hypothetical protein